MPTLPDGTKLPYGQPSDVLGMFLGQQATRPTVGNMTSGLDAMSIRPFMGTPAGQSLARRLMERTRGTPGQTAIKPRPRSNPKEARRRREMGLR